MKGIQDIERVYFLGIGGIGMSALARYFNHLGKKVSGYDKTPTTLTSQLEDEGITVHFEDDLMLIDKEADIVVYTPAIPKDHAGYNYFLSNNYNVLKRSDVLGMITQSSYDICVAGTHGKTTTSAMIAHILRHSGFGCNAFLGGIASNYGTNFWSSDNKVCVVEADEYGRSFLKLFPDVAIITAMDPDHLDIYGTPEKLEEAFIAFAAQVKKGGLLISKYGLQRGEEFKVSDKMTYSMNNISADSFAENVRFNNGSYLFDLRGKKETISDVELNMGGMHNIENVVAAINACRHVGVEQEKIKKAVAAFRGERRRFEYVVKNDHSVMIDDYAHHPEELKALVSGAKELFPGKRCVVMFQPHLFSRTKDFADGFAAALDMADEVILLPIYPAREKPMEGVNSEMIAKRMRSAKVAVLEKEDAIKEIERIRPALFITAGAGDIDKLVGTLVPIIEQEIKSGTT